MVTRARDQAPRLVAALEDLDAEVIAVPTIEITEPASWEPLDRAIRLFNEGHYRWVAFTSTNAVDRFFGRLREGGLDARAFGRTKVAAVGRSTAEELDKRGIRADLVPERFTGAALAESFIHGTGRVLIPAVVGGSLEMAAALESKGWFPEVVDAYRNVIPQPSKALAAELRSGFDAVTFTSASTVRNFVTLIGSPRRLRLDTAERIVACIGPKTAAAAGEAGMAVDIVPDEHTISGLVAALDRLWDERRMGR
ncbi:MAG TPA: uroporphyrinogen-III synthase [Actinomycetota bacterium]|nr:uroporphyrinogen-III synthase [Actinomycetota bacterium]